MEDILMADWDDYSVRYLNGKEAARYCGYHVSAFAKIIREYKIPRYGPRLNRFRKDDLDMFMENPSDFRYERPSRRKVPTRVTLD